MLNVRPVLKRWIRRLRRHRKAAQVEEGAVRHERVTVMLVPSAAWGKPLQFQTTKRAILALMAVGAISFILVVIGTIYLAGSAIFGQHEVASSRNAIEQQSEMAALKEENRQLKADLREQIEQTQQRIARVKRLISKISSFTGLPLDVPTSSTVVLTTDSAQIAQPETLGRGGPVSVLPKVETDDLLGHGSRSYANARDILLFELDMLLVQLERAARHFGDQEALLATTPLICPVLGERVFTDHFGKRLHPLYRREDFHTGLDISASHGTPIVAPADGKVTYAGYDKSKGATLTIDHGMGLSPRDGVPSKRHFKTRYFHCAKVLVKTGAKVKRGDVIALVGSTGTSTGNHCHYEVLVDDNLIDPEYFILNGQ
jgi:murein DD-endopeptidase MepM/ murein hydrolase activator NlpD